MDLAAWDERYRAELDSQTPRESVPCPLLAAAASRLEPARALDLASGSGRNALWLAQRGWKVTAVDGSPVAIKTLLAGAKRLGVAVNARVADLEKGEFAIAPSRWELIITCYYFQEDLFEPAKRGVVPGGSMVAIALMAERGRESSRYRVEPGALRQYFDGWEILHDREGADGSGQTVAEIVARRPNSDTI